MPDIDFKPIVIEAFGHRYDGIEIASGPLTGRQSAFQTIALAVGPLSAETEAWLVFSASPGDPTPWRWTHQDGEPLHAGGDDDRFPDVETSEQAATQARAAGWDVFVLLPEDEVGDNVQSGDADSVARTLT